jgi:Protein of unknown function (DUF3710)
VIFSRGRGTGRHQKPAGKTRPERSRPGGPSGPDEIDLSLEQAAESRREAGPEADGGPYDISEAPDGNRLDLGSLQIPVVDGVDIRVQANPDGLVQQVVLVHRDSLLQLSVLAAPRSAAIWDEVRDEIRASMRADGAKVEETRGEYGPELRARVRIPAGQADLRFIGVDGPRWMVQAMYQGRAAVDPAAAGPLETCLRGLVVDRGKEAKPVREVLPLRLPREVAEQAQAQAEAQARGQGGVNGAPQGPAANPPGRPR